MPRRNSWEQPPQGGSGAPITIPEPPPARFIRHRYKDSRASSPRVVVRTEPPEPRPQPEFWRDPECIRSSHGRCDGTSVRIGRRVRCQCGCHSRKEPA